MAAPGHGRRHAAPSGSPAVDAAWLDPWTRERVARLAAVEAGWAAAAAGTALVHGDLREDTILLVGDRVVLVDWPHAARGAW